MLPLVNEYSLFLIGLVVIALVLLLTGKRFGLKWGLTGMVIVVVALAAFQFISSPAPTSIRSPAGRNSTGRWQRANRCFWSCTQIIESVAFRPSPR